MTTRKASIKRKTNETDIVCEITLDGSGRAEVDTGIGFLDHMLTALARHGRFDLKLTCQGDLEVDDHHTAEDCAIVLGEAFTQALGDKRGIARFGWAYAPLDEALARGVVDLSGRPHSEIGLDLRRAMTGTMASENLSHVLASFAAAAKMTLHVDVLRGGNDHHRAEAAFKAVALALKQAVALDGSQEIPSTKGVLV